MFAMPRHVRFSEAELREAIDQSRSWAETLRRLGYRSGGGNWKTLQKYAALWGIDTDHFDPDAVRREFLHRAKTAIPLEEVLVENSTYHRGHVKRRLFAEGLKPRYCELCGQDEIWRGRRMALILDHINGMPDDNRLENLRIVCPNCAATFDTHCARRTASRRCLADVCIVGPGSSQTDASSATAPALAACDGIDRGGMATPR
jgi:hypothetical protein